MLIREAIRELCLFCAMESKDLLWVSITANVCTILFFVAQGLIGRLLALLRETVDDKSVWRSLVDKHEDEPWRLPRFFLDVVQSTVMTVMGVAILFVDDVFHHPFKGSFGSLTAAGFSFAIGCYIYRVGQDSVLHAHLKHYKVDLVHHLVAIAVCSVFLTYRENALFGVIGLISTGSVPSVEVSRLLKMLSEASGKPTALMASYRRNLAIGALITFTLRLLVPIALGGYAIATSTPLTMSVPVVAFFFTSLMFFGSISLWLCTMSILAIYRCNRRHWKNTCVIALDGESGQTFPTKHAQQSTILAKKNPISKLAPCANVNLASSSSAMVSNNNNYSLPNNYAKVPVNEALILPISQSLRHYSRYSPGDNSSEGSDTNSSSGELTVLHVGDGESTRPRAVRFLVPRTARDSVHVNEGNPSQRRGSNSLPLTLSQSHHEADSRNHESITTRSQQLLPTRTSHITSPSRTVVISTPNLTSTVTSVSSSSSTFAHHTTSPNMQLTTSSDIRRNLPENRNDAKPGGSRLDTEREQHLGDQSPAISDSSFQSLPPRVTNSNGAHSLLKQSTELGLRGWRDSNVSLPSMHRHRRANSLSSVDSLYAPRTNRPNLSLTDTDQY